MTRKYRTTRSRPRRLALFFAAAALALSACGEGCRGGGKKTSGNAQVLKWASDFPAHWDPVVQGSGGGFRVLALAYASLTEIDERGVAQPGLAASWTYNERGDEITFHLRPGLKFSDDTPVNAEAVKLYLERAKTQPNSALDGDLSSIESVRVASELDVVLQLTQVDYQIPLLLGQRVAQITSPTAARDPKQLDTKPVGAGPFEVVELVPESHVFFKKNPAFWNAANIFIDEVKLYAGTDPAMITSSIQTGVYDFGVDAHRGSSTFSQGCSAQTCLVDVRSFEGEAPPIASYEPPLFIVRPV